MKMTMKTLYVVSAFAFIVICSFAKQQQQPKPPDMTITAQQVDMVNAKLDSVTAVVVRSDMRAAERNWSADKLSEVKVFFLQNYFKQNPRKPDSTIAKK